MARKDTKTALQQHQLAPKKRFGQNFLVNPKTAESIVAKAEITAADAIVEVGVGLGALTKIIGEKAGKVIGIEVDSGLVRYHKEENGLPSNVELIHDDILRVDFGMLQRLSGSPVKIMANLPYSISNPFIFKLVENRHHMAWAIVMLQKEVAQRLTAAPSTKAYGIPTVLLGSCAQVSRLMHLSPDEFHPRPKIDSQVIRIDFTPPPEGVPQNWSSTFQLFQTIVRAAFAQRRKTLLNTLGIAPVWGTEQKRGNKQLAGEALEAAGLKRSERAENLTIPEFIRLTEEVAKRL